MRIIRYLNQNDKPNLGVVTNNQKVFSLPYSDFMQLIKDAEKENYTPTELVKKRIKGISDNEVLIYKDLNLLTPVEAPEVWAAGVTYFNSRQARNNESSNKENNSQTFYDKVYDAERPELFLKSTSNRTVSPNQYLNLRSDSNWQIPEPEVGLVINNAGSILGYTIGNDMSSRDIEGENPLYLPQAKIWEKSCSFGPAIILNDSTIDPYDFEIKLTVYRKNKKIVEETANTNQLKRKYEELISYLVKDNIIFDGTVLLTGTSIVPPNDFTLQNQDYIEIEVPEIGKLINQVNQLT